MADAWAEALTMRAEITRRMEETVISSVEMRRFGSESVVEQLELALSCNHRSPTVLQAEHAYLAESERVAHLLANERTAMVNEELEERLHDQAREARVRMARMLLAEAELLKEEQGQEAEQKKKAKVGVHAQQLQQALVQQTCT